MATVIDIVEDQRLIRDLLADGLTGGDRLQVRTTYATAEDAWERWHDDPPQAAIVDIALPGMNGVQLGVRAKRLHPHIGIVLLSSHAYPSLLDRLPADAADGWAYMLKDDVDVDAITAAWLVASSALWMVLAGILVHVITRGARRIETQAADLTRTVEELQASRIQLVQADSDVRQAIAERLHGPIQGQLIGLEHDLREHGDAVAADRLRVFRIETIREIAHQLHPMLLDVGLLPALDALVQRSPLDVSITASPAVIALDDLDEGALSAQVRRAVYVIVEEGLLNASTSAHATAVDVELEVTDDVLVVSIWDDGVGVRMPITRGLGLRSIDTWVTGLGGSWSLLPRPGRGSALTAELPVG